MKPDESGEYSISAELLERILAYLLDNHDVVDLPSGQQGPNEPMYLWTSLREEMGIRE